MTQSPLQKIQTRSRLGANTHLARIKKLAKKLLGGRVRSIGLVSLVYGINMVLGLGRDVALASTFGASVQLDAFLLGFNTLKALGVRITMATAGALVPAYVPLIMAGDTASVISLARRWSRYLSIGLALLLLAAIPFARPLTHLLGPGLNAEGQMTLAHVLMGLVPLLVVLVFAGLSKSITDSYGLYAMYPILLGAITLSVLVSVVLLGTRWGVEGVAWGIGIGAMVAFLILGIVIIRRTPVRSQWMDLFSWRPNFDSPGPPIPYKNAILLLGSSFAIQLQGIVERASVSQLPAGSITAFGLALSVLGVPTTLLLPAISSVLLPYFVRQQNRNRRIRYGLSWQQFAFILGIFLAMTAGVWIFSDIIIKVLFQRGRFTTENAALTAIALRWMSLSTGVFVISSILRQVIIARRMMLHDLAISTVILIVKAAMLLFLVPLWGLKGLGFVTLIAVCINVLLNFTVIRFISKNESVDASLSNSLS